MQTEERDRGIGGLRVREEDEVAKVCIFQPIESCRQRFVDGVGRRRRGGGDGRDRGRR